LGNLDNSEFGQDGMTEHPERLIIHKLILAREFGQQGYWWNRAFRRELWRRLAKDSRSQSRRHPSEICVGHLKSTDQNDGC
jgi:hypothetical protein